MPITKTKSTVVFFKSVQFVIVKQWIWLSNTDKNVINIAYATHYKTDGQQRQKVAFISGYPVVFFF